MDIEKIYEQVFTEIKEYKKAISLDNSFFGGLLGKNDELQEELNNLLNKNLTKILKNIDTPTMTAILNKLFTTNPSFVSTLLSVFTKEIYEKKSDNKDLLSTYKNIMEALITLELLKGNDLYEILTEDEDFIAEITKDKIIAPESAKRVYKREHEKILKEIKRYLKENHLEEVEEKEYLIPFLKNIEKYNSLIFEYTIHGEKGFIIEQIFNLLNNEDINKIYQNVLLKNKDLLTFDYNDIIIDHTEKLGTIKGLYNKCSEDTLEELFLNRKFTQKNPKELLRIIEETFNLNKDDELNLAIFANKIELALTKIEKDITDNKQKYARIEKRNIELIIKEIRNNSSYKKYLNLNKEELLNKEIEKLLNGDSNLDYEILKELGTYPKFIDNFDNFLTIFENSTNIEYKRKLIIPLAIALAMKQKEKYGIELNITDTRSSEDESYYREALGTYIENNNKLFINFKRIQEENPDNALVSIIDTILHESRHAYQVQKLIVSDKLDYDNLLMAMNEIIIKLNDYRENQEDKRNNYFHYPDERDARLYANVESKQILKNHPKLLSQVDLLRKRKEENYLLSDYITKKSELFDDTICYYVGIIDSFIKEIERTLKERAIKIPIPGLEKAYEKEITRLDKKRELLKQLIAKMPVIEKFFEIDFENKTIRPKTKEELIKENIPSNEDEQTIINWSINAFEYGKKVSQSLKERPIKEALDDNSHEDSYSEKTIEEVINNVGKPPKR